MPDEVSADPQPQEQSVRPRHHHARRRSAVSRRISSLRRSQRRLAGEELPSAATSKATAATSAPAAPSATATKPSQPPFATRRPRSTENAAEPAQKTRGRLLSSLLRPGRGQILAAIILFVVGAAGVMQIRSNAAGDTYSSARREDLIQLLDGLSAESRRLENEIAQLEQTRSNLQSGADTQRVAREEAEKHLSELSILAGTAPAQGPGIRMRIADPKAAVDAGVLLDAVEEMRDAGAEVIEVNNTIRVVGSTWFSSDSRGLVIDSKPVGRPITFEVIGDPNSLEEAARFRGGIVSEITGPKIGGQVQIERESRLVIESLHTISENQYARPASAPPTPR
jgi:uncharacterized protein YlxW (UPF0749 family)